MVEELGQIFESSGVVVVSHYAGLTVADMQDLRARARAADASVRVAKKRLAKIALEGKPGESITAGEASPRGPHFPHLPDLKFPTSPTPGGSK